MACWDICIQLRNLLMCHSESPGQGSSPAPWPSAQPLTTPPWWRRRGPNLPLLASSVPDCQLTSLSLHSQVLDLKVDACTKHVAASARPTLKHGLLCKSNATASPIVDVVDSSNVPAVNLVKMQLFPTPASAAPVWSRYTGAQCRRAELSNLRTYHYRLLREP